jgi:phosphoribosylaminoimidazole-succinocarboxamide synthase
MNIMCNENQRKFYPGQLEASNEEGKIRILSFIPEKSLVVCEVTNRISAFDVILPPMIPYKGAMLNLTAIKSMKETEDIVPNCFISMPHPRVAIWKEAIPFKVEMVIRGYLVGHAWREYKVGKRMLCGVSLPDGMVENQKFEKPIITPTTKAPNGSHDEDISREEIISRGLISSEDYDMIEEYTYILFERGTELAKKNGLILVDTKYEFGKDKKDGTIMLIDEVHTPDSSRYFYSEDYEKDFAEGIPPRQLSKEFVRQWLTECGFQGRPGDKMPEFEPMFIEGITGRYIELFQQNGGDINELTEDDDDSDLYEKVCEALEAL